MVIQAHPEIRLGGVTYRWAYETLKTTRKMRNIAASLELPILLLQAGKDNVVKDTSQNTVCSRAQNCTLIRYPDAAHNLFYETDKTRNKVSADVMTFLDGLDSPGQGCSGASPVTLVPVVSVAVLLLCRRARWARILSIRRCGAAYKRTSTWA
jgi:alpha-beta hydrolase superfamily lysophospholipase